MFRKSSNNCNYFWRWPTHSGAEKTDQNDFQLLHTKQFMDRRGKKHWSQTFILLPFSSWIYFCHLGCTHLMIGHPLIQGCVSMLMTVSIWFLDSVWLFLQKLSNLRQITETNRILHLTIHLVQTWMPRVTGWPSLGSSVESHEAFTH